MFWLRGDGILLNGDVQRGRVDHPLTDGDELQLTAGAPPFILRTG